MLVAGEPGGGEPAFREKLEEGWGAKVTEAMGIGDIGVSLWGECEQQDGMHLGARGFVHPELIDPETGAAVELEDGATGELVLTHLRHRAAPLLRFRTRDHVQVRMSPCACGRTGPRVRCIGRTDDMLIVRGVNVFPSAVREVVSEFAPRGQRPHPRPAAVAGRQAGAAAAGQRRARARGAADDGLAEEIRERLRSVLDRAGPTSSSCPGAACSAASTSRSSSNTEGRGRTCGSFRARASTTSRSSGADRQTSIDFWEGVLGMPFVFEQPNLDNAGESHLYFDPGDGRLITVFTDEIADARPEPHRDRSGLRPPHRVLALAGHLPAGGRAARRARDLAQRREGSRLHGLDLLRGSARA